jgi:predicted DNA-binding protein YlxM (UPF0122 family)
MKATIFRQQPYRGILTEIAKEQGVTPQAIHQAIRLKNTRILEIATQKVNQRTKLANKAKAEFKKAEAILN